MTRLFVAKADKLSKIKVTRLRRLMNMGSRLHTPLEKKPTFTYVMRGGFVLIVSYFAPYNDSVWPDAIFNLNEQTRIPVEDWFNIMLDVNMYDNWKEVNARKDKLRTLIKNLEVANEAHGQRISICANGFISGDDEVSRYLKSTASLCINIRRELYKELGLDK